MRGAAIRRTWTFSACRRRGNRLCLVTPGDGSLPALRNRALHLGDRGSPSLAFTSSKTWQYRHYVSSAVDHREPTIYALSSASGQAAIAVIRISGAQCLHIYRSLCPDKRIPRPRYATLRALYQPGRTPCVDTLLDSNALVLYFPEPRTVTGQDVLELHVHGGTAIVKAVLAAISACSLASRPIRYAEPGEFTRRAFQNDRLDLTQVEALGDVLSATTEQQRKVSVRGSANTLARTYERWRQQLLYARGELEALIDFSEDQHFDESPAELCASVSSQVRSLQVMLAAHIQNAMRGEMLRHGISVALLGAPNVGKSSLLNLIVRREAAIVSQEEGTTRDVVEVGIDLGGFFCRLGDTAGLRRSGRDAGTASLPQQKIGSIEEEGMRRSKERAANSDVVIVVLSFEMRNGIAAVTIDPEVLSTATELIRTKNNVIVVINKSDQIPNTSSLEDAMQISNKLLPELSQDRIHFISCKIAHSHTSHSSIQSNRTDPGGLQAFLNSLIQYFHQRTSAVRPTPSANASIDGSNDPSVWQESLGASERHRLLLLHCAENLDAFQKTVGQPYDYIDPSANSNENDSVVEADMVVAAEHLRSAADCLAKITGKGEAGDVEEVLGVVFEKFCVGK